MSKPLANSPEACITKFLRDAKKAKERQSKYASKEYLDGMQFVIGLAEIWFSDKLVELEAEPCAA